MGKVENPYLGILALSDYIVVTDDSVTMASEASSTGKPVYVVPLLGGSAKFNRFHKSLQDAGIARPLGLALESWQYAPLRETARVAELVKNRMKK
jgi:mitochondrial fission protein ELM1